MVLAQQYSQCSQSFSKVKYEQLVEIFSGYACSATEGKDF